MNPRRLILLGIVIFATFLRFWQLDSMPPGLYHDEAYNGLDAQALNSGQTFPLFHESWELYSADAHANRPPTATTTPIFFEGNYGREPLHIYLMALSLKLFGSTAFALRAVPATAGVLAVLTTYWTALAVSGQRSAVSLGDRFVYSSQPKNIALLAAFLLAILFPAIHFSRFALRAMLFVPVETLAVYCFWRGIQTKQYTVYGIRYTVFWWLATGALLGFGLYIYAAARLFPLVFALFVAGWFWHSREARQRYWRPFVGLVGMAIVVALPLLLYFWRYPYFFIFRTAYVANRGKGTVEGKAWLTWGLNIGRTLRGLYWHGETHLRHNLPGRAYLDPIQATFFSLGVFSLLRIKKESVFLLIWLVVMLLPTILSGDAPHFGRMTGAAPVIAIISAYGIVWLLRSPTSWEKLDFWIRPIIALLLIISLLLTIRAYFIDYANKPLLPSGSYPVADGFYQPDWELGQMIANLPATTAVYLTPPQAEMATILFALDGDTTKLRAYDGMNGLIPAGIPTQDALYLVRPHFVTTIEHLRAFYGDVMTETWQDEIVVIEVEADVERNPLDVQVDLPLNEAVKIVGYSAHSDTSDQLTITLAWQTTAPLTESFTAFVHLIDGDGNTITQNDHPPTGYPTTSWRVGEIVIDHFTLDWSGEPIRLRTGFYNSQTLEPFGMPIIFSQP